MGCDCTMVVEKQTPTGDWEMVGGFDVCRSYELFGQLCRGVRSSPHWSIGAAAGFPVDVDPVTKEAIEFSADHNFNWCSVSECYEFFSAHVEAFEYNDHGFHCFLKFLKDWEETDGSVLRLVYGFDS